MARKTSAAARPDNAAPRVLSLDASTLGRLNNHLEVIRRNLVLLEYSIEAIADDGGESDSGPGLPMSKELREALQHLVQEAEQAERDLSDVVERAKGGA